MKKDTGRLPTKNGETGKFTSEYSQEDFLDAIVSIDGVAGTGDIASEVECSHDTAYKRLQQLEKDSAVKSHKVGNTLVWEVTDDA